MKKKCLFVTALVCAFLFAAGIASAQPVAGFGPNLADPQPNTSATLEPDANRLIRWQGWLDVDAFSASVLEQMQKQLGNGIEVGKFTIAEPSISDAVDQVKASASVRGFVVNENLNAGGESFEETPKFYVWLYRHNYTDTGLYQLYVSVKGPMLIGKGFEEHPTPQPHKDIQALGYEFGTDGVHWSPRPVNVIRDVEIWRGAVVRVNAKGAIEVVGNEAGVITVDNKAVEKAPIADWEVAPVLPAIGKEDHVIYDPQAATGPEYVDPLDRKDKINENKDQKKAGGGNVPTPRRITGGRLAPR